MQVASIHHLRCDFLAAIFQLHRNDNFVLTCPALIVLHFDRFMTLYVILNVGNFIKMTLQLEFNFNFLQSPISYRVLHKSAEHYAVSILYMSKPWQQDIPSGA